MTESYKRVKPSHNQEFMTSKAEKLLVIESNDFLRDSIAETLKHFLVCFPSRAGVV